MIPQHDSPHSEQSEYDVISGLRQKIKILTQNCPKCGTGANLFLRNVEGNYAFKVLITPKIIGDEGFFGIISTLQVH